MIIKYIRVYFRQPFRSISAVFSKDLIISVVQGGTGEPRDPLSVRKPSLQNEHIDVRSRNTRATHTTRVEGHITLQTVNKTA